MHILIPASVSELGDDILVRLPKRLTNMHKQKTIQKQKNVNQVFELS